MSEGGSLKHARKCNERVREHQTGMGGREEGRARPPSSPPAADQQTIKKANVPFSAILTEVLFSLEVGRIFVL